VRARLPPARRAARPRRARWLRRYILTSLRSAGFVPFYASKQPNGKYMQVQEGAQSLHSRYEVAYGNINICRARAFVWCVGLPGGAVCGGLGRPG